MDRKTAHNFDFAIQSSCLVGLLDSSSGQVFYVKSPGSDNVPVREQKMMAIIASSAIYATMSSQSEVNVEAAFGSAVHIIWKTVASSLVVLVLGSVSHFRNAASLDDSAAMISACCEFLFGNILAKDAEGLGTLRLQHGQMAVLGRFIDCLFKNSSNQQVSPLTFKLPLVEVCPSNQSVETLSSCLTSFCESVNAVSGIIFSSGKISLISPEILDIMDTLHLRCFVAVCISIREMATETTAIRRKSSSLRSLNSQQNFSPSNTPRLPAPASFSLFIPDKKEKDKFAGFQILCTAIPLHNSEDTDLYGVFMFPASTGEELLPENVSAEVSRYWSPIFTSRYEEETVKSLGLATLVEQTSFSKIKGKSNKISDNFLPMVMCIANANNNFCCIPSLSGSSCTPDMYSRLVSLITKALKQFCSAEGAHQQTLSRRPSAVCLRYPDSLCVAISRHPLNVFAVLPAACPFKDALTFVSEFGFENYLQYRFALCH